MAWVIFLFGSGLVFFFGVGLILGSVLLARLSRPRWLARSASLFAVLGILFVSISATPLPYWFYALAGIVMVSWLIAGGIRTHWFEINRLYVHLAVILTCLTALGLEIPYHLKPRLGVMGRPALHIIGDSVTAGTGEKDTLRWPNLLSKSHGIAVRDYSQPGATVTSALKQAGQLPEDGGIILLEIGGNDILGSTSVAKFEEGLERLLGSVTSPGRTVLMFELPLLPFQNDYGLVQRRLASQHGVRLIPKRIFVSVLSAEGRTLDSVHLSKAGHERMAEVVWGLIESAYRE